MIITNSTKPIRVIGYAESTITQEGMHFFPKDWSGEIGLITPEEFLVLPNKDDYQYMVYFTLDIELRIKIIDIIETMKLDCFSYVNDTVTAYVDRDQLSKIIGHGSVVMLHSSVLLHSKIGKHCIVETYCLVSHYCELGDNVILHSGTMIAGRTKIGSNSVFNFKSATLNGLTICDNVEVGALSTVTKNITQSGKYVGTIARYVGERVGFNQ
jgi:acetyltransferase-like isoleucine patch superfamily enzyme